MEMLPAAVREVNVQFVQRYVNYLTMAYGAQIDVDRVRITK